MKYNDRHTRNIVSKYQDKDHSNDYHDRDRNYKSTIKKNMRMFETLLKHKYRYWFGGMAHINKKDIYAKYILLETHTIWANDLDNLIFSYEVKSIDLEILEKVYQENNPNMDSYRDSQIDKIIGILE